MSFIFLCCYFVVANWDKVVGVYFNLQGYHTLPNQDANSAIAYYKNGLWMFGGQNYRKQLVIFNLSTQTQIDYDPVNLSVNTYGSSQYYAQINWRFYWIDADSGLHMNVYNLRNRQFQQHEETMFYNVHSGACLATDKTLLFVIGGVTNASVAMNSFQIFNKSNNVNQWFEGPTLLRPTTQHSCAVDSKRNVLYSISGFQGQMLTDHVDKISIDHIVSQTWSSNHDLNVGVLQARAIYINSNTDDSIIVIGGYTYTPNNCNQDSCKDVTNTIQNIDCETGLTSTLGQLSDDLFGTAAVITDHMILYLLGGNDNNGAIDKIYYTQLSTDAPTGSPTNEPTNNYTTSAPTPKETLYAEQPIAAPTLRPSEVPTFYPTQSPNETILNTSTTGITYTQHVQSKDGIEKILAVLILLAVLLIVYVVYMKCYRKRNKFYTKPNRKINNNPGNCNPNQEDIGNRYFQMVEGTDFKPNEVVHVTKGGPLSYQNVNGDIELQEEVSVNTNIIPGEVYNDDALSSSEDEGFSTGQMNQIHEIDGTDALPQGNDTPGQSDHNHETPR